MRRGAEGMRELRKHDFKLVEDPNFNWKYYKKVRAIFLNNMLESLFSDQK